MTAIADPLRNYVFYDENTTAFDVQPTAKQTTGPSPFAKEGGPSVLLGYTPKRPTGALDLAYKYTESTPELGRTYHDADVADILSDPGLLSDLAITIAERGVVFFKNQHSLTVAQQKDLVHLLGVYAGKPETSGLHIHPTTLAGGLLEPGGEKIDPTVSLISSQLARKLYRPENLQTRFENLVAKPNVDSDWHSDVTFEPVPADFSSLRVVETPSGAATAQELSRPGGGPVGGSGGDTLWASGYALAERVSPPLLKFLETLTGEFSQPQFASATSSRGVPLYTAARGAPENVGDELLAYHPVVRTNPTTGWKSIFAIGAHFRRFVGLSNSESVILKEYLLQLLLTSPEVQLRFKWSQGDIAIWDNRSTFHSAIYDIVSTDGDVEVRTGIRTVSVGERPFFDPYSVLKERS